MEKNYWGICKKNFRAMAIASIIIFVILGVGFADGTNPYTVRMSLLPSIGFFAVTTILFFTIASMFKKQSAKAIPVAYTYLSIAFIYSVVTNFIMSSPSSGLIYKSLGLLVLIYLFVSVYKASKQTVQSN